MSDSVSQNDVDSLVSQLQADHTALAADTQALDQAAQMAAEIAGEIHAAQNAPPPPVEAAPSAAPQRAGGRKTETAAPEPSASDTALDSPDVRRLLAIEVPVIVQLGVRRMTVGEVMRFAVGAIIEFSKSAEEELELLANNQPVGKGHAVKVGENFGIKLTRIGSVKETIRKLGAT
jgi:flagellar motor switch protein FliN